MKVLVSAAARLTATTLAVIGVSVGGCPSAAAQPNDYSVLPINPNEVTDSTAYSAALPIQNPNGQPGVTTVYTHRDGTRQITNTILILPDAAAAAAALEGSKAALNNTVKGGNPQPAAVGTGGTMVSGSSPDGSKSVTVLMFTEGNAATTIEFGGPPSDPIPVDMVAEFGQKQASAIRNGPSV
jgi:hypothetical protein